MVATPLETVTSQIEERWLQPNGVVPIDAETTGKLVNEVVRVRGLLNRSLDMHHRNLLDSIEALRTDRGHHCESRKTLDAIYQRSWDAIKS